MPRAASAQQRDLGHTTGTGTLPARIPCSKGEKGTVAALLQAAGAAAPVLRGSLGCFGGFYSSGWILMQFCGLCFSAQGGQAWMKEFVQSLLVPTGLSSRSPK